MPQVFYVYILANRRRGALYIGVSSDPLYRLYLHRTGTGSRHVQRYGIQRLVYLESFSDWESAIACEKRLKRWRRAWKIALIEQANPAWRDLLPDLAHGPG